MADYKALAREMYESMVLGQDGDKVASRVTFSGTHQGDFMGLPASGNRVEWDVIDILQFRDNQAVAHWGVMDMAGAMAQMGAGPG
jgi:predicted ester cyclase